MAFMSVGGAAGVFANPVVALVPIGIILATSLGYDAFTGFLFVYMGAYSGFNVGWANATTIGVAHPIAELPIFSGFEVRVLLNIINFAICYFFTVRYMKTIRKDPMKSLNYEEGMSVADFMGAKGETTETIHASMSWKHMVSLLGLVAAIAVIVIGSIKFSWSYDQMAATFFVLAVGCGLLNGMGVNGTTKEFINGCAKDQCGVYCWICQWHRCDPVPGTDFEYHRQLAFHPDLQHGICNGCELHVHCQSADQLPDPLRIWPGGSGNALNGSHRGPGRHHKTGLRSRPSSLETASPTACIPQQEPSWEPWPSQRWTGPDTLNG